MVPEFQIEHLRNHPEDKTLDLNKVAGFALNMAGQSVYFKKRLSFREQLEYRWLWIAESKVPDRLLVTAPEAKQFCRPWYADTDLIDFNISDYGGVGE
jgi:hypothetical protein